jgi:hypothetical protein
MSNRPDLRVNTKEPSSFTNKWISEAVRETRGDFGLVGFPRCALYPFEPLINTQEEGLAIKDVRPSDSRGPTQPPGALPVARSGSAASALWRSTFTIVVMAGLTFFIVGMPWTSGTNKSGRESSSFWSLSLERAMAEPAIHRDAKLFVNEQTPQPMDEAVPLGVSVPNANDDTILIFAGIVKGTTLSSGRPLGDHAWWLFAKDLRNVMIRPPPHYVGVMDITVELRPSADTAAGDYRMLRFEWAEAKASDPKVTNQADVLKFNLQSQPIHQPDHEENAALLKRGNDLISSGDVAAARMVLQRAVEAGDARAALALAGTYDPATLQKLRVHGLSPDLAMARHWYEKASELGSPYALQRLEMLARKPD